MYNGKLGRLSYLMGGGIAVLLLLGATSSDSSTASRWRRSFDERGATIDSLESVIAHDRAAHAARESVVINQGDTVTWKFSVRTDSVLKPAGVNSFVGATCGTSASFARPWHGAQAIGGDSLTVTVVNCKAAAQGKYVLYNDVVLDTAFGVITPKLANTTMVVGDARCMLVVEYDANGVLMVGDKYGPGGVCTDTTVDPAKITYPRPVPNFAAGMPQQRLGAADPFNEYSGYKLPASMALAVARASQGQGR